MARRLSRPTLIALFALPLSAALGLAETSCSSEKEETGTSIHGVEKIIYAVRKHTYTDEEGVKINVAGGMGQVMDYLRYVPGGRLEVYDLSKKSAENILEAFATADISGLDLSFDATKVVFSMKQNADDNYHIYWAGVQRGENGQFEIHQLTFGPQDDIHPVYVAGDRVAFVTNQGYTEMGTRADEYNHPQIVTQIATITLLGGDADRKLCSQNLSHTINLFSMADGRIGFSRWEHLENINDVKIFAMNPDCTQMVAIAGQHGKPGNSLVQVSETNTPNVFLGVATSRENTIQAGRLIQIDARNPNDATRAFEEKPEEEMYVVLTPSVPEEEEASPIGRYRTPFPLPDGRILTTWASGFVNELNELSLTPPDFGVYVYDPDSRANQLVVNYEDSWEVYAQPIVATTQPPILSSIQDTADPSVATVLGSIDIKQTSLGETVSGAQFADTPLSEALAQAKKVRIIEGFSSEAAKGVNMFGLTMAEGAAVLGEADVYTDGSWLASIPPYVPVHLQPIDEFELAIRNQTLWIQGMPGEDRVCGGCHEDRSRPVLPGGQQQTLAKSAGAEKLFNFNLPVAQRTEYPWHYADDTANPNEIQKLLNAKCVSCHNETTNGSGAQEYYQITMTNEVTGTSEVYQIPRMDLSDRDITVTYDNETRAWPASYVSIFYPAALAMEMEMGTTITGTLPPQWGRPSDARGSALIEKLNMMSSLDANKTAWPLGAAFSDPTIKGGTRSLHPENVGTTLTREERTMLIRAIDLGGQFYARQNTQFVPFANNPLGPGQQY